MTCPNVTCTYDWPTKMVFKVWLIANHYMFDIGAVILNTSIDNIFVQPGPWLCKQKNWHFYSHRNEWSNCSSEKLVTICHGYTMVKPTENRTWKQSITIIAVIYWWWLNICLHVWLIFIELKIKNENFYICFPLLRFLKKTSLPVNYVNSCSNVPATLACFCNSEFRKFFQCLTMCCLNTSASQPAFNLSLKFKYLT